MKTLIFEINEISKEVIIEYIKKNPSSNLSKFKFKSHLYCKDIDEKILYPSQAWASLNSGVSAKKSQVKWFNDQVDLKKFYWMSLLNLNKSISIVNSLYTSQINRKNTKNKKLKFLIPDFFSKNTFTIPDDYKYFQELNLMMTKGNRRVSSFSSILKIIKIFFKRPNLKYWGLNNFLAIKQIVYIILSSIIHNKERLRSAQFTMQISLFFNSITTHKPDLGIFFTNHIASMMHRYLPAYFDEKDAYDDAWIKKYSNEVGFSVKIFDEWLEKFFQIKKRLNLNFVLLTPISQKINKKVTKKFIKDYSYDYIIFDLGVFLKKIFGLNINDIEELVTMHPQYSFKIKNKKIANKTLSKLKNIKSDNPIRYGHYTKKNKTNNYKNILNGAYIHLDQKKDIFTLTFFGNKDYLIYNKKRFFFKKIGIKKVFVDTHHSGEHSKNGLIYSTKKIKNLKNRENYLNLSNLLFKHIKL